MKPRDWFEDLDRLRAGELPPAELTKFETELSRNPEAHREYARISAELEELKRAEPPEQAAPSRRQIMTRALALSLERRTARRSPVLRWAPAALVPLAAAAAILLVWSLREIKETPPGASQSPELTLQSGNVEAGGRNLERGARIAPSTELRVAADRAELALWDASILRAPRDTKIAYSAVKPEDRLVLLQGELELKVKPREQGRPLVVQTAEADTWVVGTEFVVRRARRGAAFATTVAVSEGTVRVVTRPDGETRLLSAGQEASFGAPPVAAVEITHASEPPEGVAAVSPEKDRETEATRGSERQATTASIREKLRQGSIGTARQLIQQARAQGAGDAELSVLEAEADLAERRYASARQRYLRIVEKYPTSREAELSLFAAAQLSHGSSSIDLLQRYLARYPNGRFAREAHRLLDTLDAKKSDR